MAPKVGIGVFITSPTGQIILGKRKGSVGSGRLPFSPHLTDRLTDKGTWAVPGGHLEDGESFETCAAREVHEETGLNVSGMRFLTATNSIMVEEGKHYVTVFMGCQIPGDGEPRVSVSFWSSWTELMGLTGLMNR